MMPGASESWKRLTLPWAVAVGAVTIWAAVSAAGLFPESLFPSPSAIWRGFGEEWRSGRLTRDIVASLFRVGAGFALAVALGIPLGLWLGHRRLARAALMPAIHFLRNLSPLAWIPFAVLWFGIGDPPTIFLIFLASFFPVALSATLAVATVSSVYFRVAADYGLHGWEMVVRVTLPAIMPQVIAALRVAAGVAWVVVVAAEMVAGRDGLGFAILDARNGLRTDLVVVSMIVIGAIGVLLDRALAGMARIPSVRWGYER